MDGPGQIVGDDPLVDGMVVSVRLRRDFTVTNADHVLTIARRLYCDLNPGTSADEAVAMVTSAADALFVILEQVGLIGEEVDGRLAEYEADGLALAGWRAQVTRNEPNPLRAGADCLRTDDVFALPTPDAEEA